MTAHDVARLPSDGLADRLAASLDDALARHDLDVDELRTLLGAVATGIAELRAAEAELVASHAQIDAERERYGQLFEFAPDGYLETDRLGKVLEANSAAARLLAVPVRFLKAKLVFAFVAERDRRQLRQVVVGQRDGDEPVTLEVELWPRAAAPVPAELRVVATYDDTARETRLRWLLRDVSQRVALDGELRQLHADVELLSSIAELNRLVADDDPSGAMFDRLAGLASTATGASAGIGVCDRSGRLVVRAASDDVAAELCEVQAESGGPSTEVLDADEPVVAVGPALDRWPALAAAAASRGARWVLARPLRPRDGAAGVLTLFGTGTATPESAVRVVDLVADQAAGIIGNQVLYRSAQDLAAQLEVALESRGVIEQAKGVLIASQGCGPDEAFDLLRRASQRENRKLRAIAEEVVERAVSRSGRPPG